MRFSFICVVLYIGLFNEAIASECSTSHMAPHIYWFPWMRTGSRHGPWNSLPLYLGETIGVSASVDSAVGTGFYKLLSVFAILYMLRMSKFCMPTLINHKNNETTVKQHPLAFILFNFQAGEACPSAICLSAIFSCDQTALQMVFSVCLSVCLSHTPFSLCSHHRIIMKFSGVITNETSKVHAKGQGQRSKVKVTETKTQLNRFRTVTPVWIHIWWWNDAHSLMLLRGDALSFFKLIRQISRSHG